MAKLVNMAKAIRRNWKKSTVAFLALMYGTSYGIERYKTSQLMRAYCEEAKRYGELPVSKLQKARHVTVILNPVAHNKKSKSLYEKYAAPLLHLAGLKVSLIVTENEGQAKDLMEIMANTDAVAIAGGNGTLHEAVTGLLRRPEYEEDSTSAMPIGILPVGNTNLVARALFKPWSTKDAQWLAEATMAIIKESTKALDVIRIQGPEEKPVYALCGVELGNFVNLEASLPKYWYFGPLKAKVAYFYNSLKRYPVINDVEMEYIPPCEGCSKCCLTNVRKKKTESQRWWMAFLPKVNSNGTTSMIDYSKVTNEDCGSSYRRNSPFSNLVIATSLKNFCSIAHDSSKAFWMNIYSSELKLTEYLSLGSLYHKGENPGLSEAVQTVPAREVKLSTSYENERSCYIDSELYNFKPISVSLLPKHLIVYG